MYTETVYYTDTGDTINLYIHTMYIVSSAHHLIVNRWINIKNALKKTQ